VVCTFPINTSQIIIFIRYLSYIRYFVLVSIVQYNKTVLKIMHNLLIDLFNIKTRGHLEINLQLTFKLHTFKMAFISVTTFLIKINV
jgi:hypothetical protein